jgi:hypothetical protein
MAKTKNVDGLQIKDRPEETKAERFLRLAPVRVDNALMRLGQLRQLAAAGTYEYTDEQAERIVSKLEEEVRAVARDLRARRVSRSGFQL